MTASDTYYIIPTYAFYIIAAYAICFIVLGGITLSSLYAWKKVKKDLDR